MSNEVKIQASIVVKASPDSSAYALSYALSITRHAILDGVFWADTYCNGYDHYRALPQVIQFQGKTLVKMGWNSDIMMASYKESDSFALYK